MSKGKGWDLTSTHSLEAAAEWLRSKSDALVVVVIRANDGAIAADPLLEVIDVHDRVWEGVGPGSMPKLLEGLRKSRDEERGRVLKREAKANGRQD